MSVRATQDRLRISQALNHQLDHILSDFVYANSMQIPVTSKAVEDAVRKDPKLAIDTTLFFKVADIVQKCAEATKSPENEGSWNNCKYAYSVAHFMFGTLVDRIRSKKIPKKFRMEAKNLANAQSDRLMKLNNMFGQNLGIFRINQKPSSWDIIETYKAAVKTAEDVDVIEILEPEKPAKIGNRGNKPDELNC
jgi:hypothetical protein